MNDQKPRTIRDILLELGELLEQLPLGTAPEDVPVRSRSMRDGVLPKEELLQRAQYEYDERGRRNAFFDGELFGEPAWDIMLDLYISSLTGRQVSVSSVCIGARAPASTAMRWIKVLEDRGAIVRNSHQSDKRVYFLSLASSVAAQFDRFFSEAD